MKLDLKKLLSLVAALALYVPTLKATDYYVAPDGSDLNIGTEDMPFKSISKAIGLAAPGTKIYLRGGTFQLHNEDIMQSEGVYDCIFYIGTNGTENNPITLSGYPGEDVTIDLSEISTHNRLMAFCMKADYWHLRNFDITGIQVTQKGHTQSINVGIFGANNCIIEQVNIHDGMGIGVYATHGRNNLVLNCDAYNNYDPVSEGGYGGNCDGFGFHLKNAADTGNVVRGCRAWHNSDDGFDLINNWAPVIIENCWAWENGYDADKISRGDGTGFKSGGYGMRSNPKVPEVIPRNIVRNCLAYGNKQNGFYANHHLGGLDFSNNTAYRNRINYNMVNRKSTTEAVDVPGYNHCLYNNLSYKPLKDGADCINIALSECIVDHNTFLPPMQLDDSYFESLDPDLLLSKRNNDGSLPDISFMRLKAGNEVFESGIGRQSNAINKNNRLSNVWQPDLGNGFYKNPIINADYSDPDVICVDSVYYMTASSFCCTPGLPILRSYDLVNWEIVNHAVSTLQPEETYNIPQHGNGVWAPAIRHHNGTFFILWGDPDYGVFMVKTTDPLRKWEQPVLIMEAKGIIDTCPLWDNDGKAYLINAWAKSRSGLNGVLTVSEMTPDGTNIISSPVMVYDGIPEGNHTLEGPKFYKRNDYYYILAPAGSVTTGWQLALRSKNIFGPYEARTIMAQGNTQVNGPHQGAWVETPYNENWFIHFQDKGTIGRVIHLQPMKWIDDWPVIGADNDGDGCGEPVLQYKKPIAGKSTAGIRNPAESDEFDTLSLGKQWQWMANYQLPFGFTSSNGYYRLYGHNLSENFANMREVPNLLTQKFPNDTFTATAKVTVSATQNEQKSGIIVFGRDYGALAVEKVDNGFELKYIECYGADKGKAEVETPLITLPITRTNGEGLRSTYDLDIFLRIKVEKDDLCKFLYSTDGKNFIDSGHTFKAREGQWIGAKIGFFSVQPPEKNRGWIDIDYFRINK